MYPNPLERKHSTFRQVIDRFLYPEKKINKAHQQQHGTTGCGWKCGAERRKTAPGCGK